MATTFTVFSLGKLADMDTFEGNTVAENAAIGAVVGVTALASDADTDALVTYTLDDDAGGRVFLLRDVKHLAEPRGRGPRMADRGIARGLVHHQHIAGGGRGQRRVVDVVF